MKTYLVRTIADQTLMGIFCAESTAELADTIDSVFDARECEYLELRSQEGLFIEAKFAQVPAEDGRDQVVLTHVDDPLEQLCPVEGLDDESGDEEASAEAELLLAMTEEGYIPPVLEPTHTLHDRLQVAEQEHEWRPVRTGASSDTLEHYKSRIDADSIARKLLQGPLSPLTFIKAPSNRLH